MPYTMTFLDDGKGMVLEYQGIVTPTEGREARGAFTARDKGRLPCKYCLQDLSHASFDGMTTQQVRESGQTFSRERDPPEVVCAFVVRDALVYGLVKVWRAWAVQADWEVRIFDTREPAVVWLRERVKARFGFMPTVK
jgi:hypothetical protein